MLTASSDRWQPALFDDRSTRAASERASVLEVHRVHFEHLKPTLARAPEPTDEPTIEVAEPPRLIGVWLHD
jgi:hypothetical protein